MAIKLAVNATSLLSPLTGIGQYTYQLMSALVESGEVDPEYFYGFGWSKMLRDFPMPGIVGTKNFIKQKIPGSYSVMRGLMQTAFSLHSATSKFEIYHDPNFIPFRTSVPTIITVHDLSFVRFPEAHPADRVAFMNRNMPRGLERAEAILVDSEFVRGEVISEYAVPPEKIRAIPLGVSAHFHQRPRPMCEAMLNVHGLKFGQYILAVGTLEPRKNLVNALKAYSRLPLSLREDLPLVLIGMKGWLNAELDELIAPLIRAGQVRWLGYITNEDLPKFYSGAMMFIYPSIYEGFGLPILEAMACGIPVIASNRSSLPEVVGDAGIQIDPMDIDALSNAIIKLAYDEDERTKRGMAGMARAKEFTWGKCASKTLEVYKKILHRA